MQPQGALRDALGRVKTGSSDELLALFLDYVAARGLELYPAQEEAILELFSGKHVVLATPTGSGKSLVATALVFRTLANGGRAFYTSPIKALVNEKFFALCDDFGAEEVGLLTGDFTINPDARIIACTAEIVASMALREGAAAHIDALVADEFHFYGDRERGVAWHLPLLVLERTHFLLMSATIGDPATYVSRLEALTKRPATLVEANERPVPLDFVYSEEPLHETVRDLVGTGKAPVYIVAFTQRACAEEAQNLMSENFCTKEEKRLIAEALDGQRWDSPYGKEISRFVRHGIGLHHAGLLPKYRFAVEKLAQKGLLKVVCGTDTLGVGVNIPIRTVLFTKLCKFDGEKTTLLGTREFQQIAGRAGRKGFDDRGSVVVQAPEHVIENIKIARKRDSDPKKYKKLQNVKPPLRGYVPWDRQTFERLTTGKPEPLVGRFAISHGMLVDLLDSPVQGKHGGYGRMLELVSRAYVTDKERRALRKLAPTLFRTLRTAEIVELAPRPDGKRGKVARVASDLQRDFSLMHALSLYLVELLPFLETRTEDQDEYARDVLSAVEAIVEDPRVILERQLDKLKGDKIAELKAQGVEYEERMAQIEKLTYPRPNAELFYETFNAFAAHHPWVASENVRPKSIAREMIETGMGFDDYVREYDLARVEGTLLRYLSEVVKTLDQTVPVDFKTDAVYEIFYALRSEVKGTDASLLDEWEGRVEGREVERKQAPARRVAEDDPKVLLARGKRDLSKLLRALSRRDVAGMVAAVRGGEGSLDAERIETAEKAFHAARGALVLGETLKSEHLRISETPDGMSLYQTLVDVERTADWGLELRIVVGPTHPEGDPVLDLVGFAEA